jgi:hypothetical protein
MSGSASATAAAWEKRKRQLAKEFIAPQNPPIPSVPHPPIDPYFIIPPVDFSPFIAYEPTLSEFTHTFEVPFNSLQHFDLFDVYTSGKLPNDPLKPEIEKELDFMMSLEEAEQEKKRRQKGASFRIVTASKSTDEVASGSSTPLSTQSPLSAMGSKSDLRFEGKPMEYQEASPEEKTLSEEIITPEPDDSVMRHPDNPSLYATRRVPLRLNPEISKIIGSVYFEDEIPDNTKLQGGVLKAINDPSLPSCTAGWLYINKRGKDNADIRNLYREFEMDQSNREYELLAIRIPQDESKDKADELEEDQENLFADYGEIKETFTVRKRPDAQRMEIDKATTEEDKELLEELKVKPEPEIVCNVEAERVKLLERLN